jgi:hypothetical protein
MADGSTFFTQPPLRASADVNTCRVVGKSGDYTASQVADKSVEPLGISAEWTKDAPLPGASTLHAKSATADNVTYHGRGQKAHGEVGSAISGAMRVSAAADGTGKVIPFVAPGWSVGWVFEAAPVNSKVEVFVDPQLVGDTLAQQSFAGLKTLNAAGRNGAGAITLTGAAVGDRVVLVLGVASAAGSANTLVSPEGSFETTITVVDQIQQTDAADLSGSNYMFVLAPALA